MKNIFYVLAVAMFAVAGNAYATEEVAPLQCEAGFHVESVLISEAVPAVEEVSHIVYHEAVTEEVTTCEKAKFGAYKDCQCKQEAPFLFSGQRFDKVTETVVVEEAYEEVVIDVPAQDEVPAVYEDQCVADVPPTDYCPLVDGVQTEEEPCACSDGFHEEEGSCIADEVTPEPTPVKRGGGGKCLNCEKEEVADEEAPVEDEVVDVPDVEDTTVPDEPAPACQKLRTYIKFGEQNDTADVSLLQSFLGLPVTGTYDLPTFMAVHEFQNAQADDVLNPWAEMLGAGYGHSTGWVYRTTQWKINTMLCPNEYIPFPTIAGY